MRANAEPLVSLVTPSFNQGAFLEATLESVLGQTWPAIEHVVMDGGSTDESAAVLERYRSRLAHVQSAPDGGFADALRSGFARCTGSVFGYLNSDDLLAPRAVEEAVRFLEAHPQVVLVYGNRICIDEHGRLLYVRPSPPRGARSPHAHHVLGQETCFWRRAAHERAGGIDASYRFAVDYDLFSRLAQLGPFGHCGRIWGFFRKHGASKTMTSYAAIGAAEVARVQDAVWHRRPGRLETALAHGACRLYGLTGGAWCEAARWPPDVPRPLAAPWRDRFARSLPPSA
jgi:glycosyltransferase involved in cell wall biosynthesis